MTDKSCWRSFPQFFWNPELIARAIETPSLKLSNEPRVGRIDTYRPVSNWLDAVGLNPARCDGGNRVHLDSRAQFLIPTLITISQNAEVEDVRTECQ